MPRNVVPVCRSRAVAPALALATAVGGRSCCRGPMRLRRCTPCCLARRPVCAKVRGPMVAARPHPGLCPSLLLCGRPLPARWHTRWLVVLSVWGRHLRRRLRQWRSLKPPRKHHHHPSRRPFQPRFQRQRLRKCPRHRHRQQPPVWPPPLPPALGLLCVRHHRSRLGKSRRRHTQRAARPRLLPRQLSCRSRHRRSWSQLPWSKRRTHNRLGNVGARRTSAALHSAWLRSTPSPARPLRPWPRGQLLRPQVAQRTARSASRMRCACPSRQKQQRRRQRRSQPPRGRNQAGRHHRQQVWLQLEALTSHARSPRPRKPGVAVQRSVLTQTRPLAVCMLHVVLPHVCRRW